MRIDCETQQQCADIWQAQQDVVMAAVGVTVFTLLMYVGYRNYCQWQEQRNGPCAPRAMLMLGQTIDDTTMV